MANQRSYNIAELIGKIRDQFELTNAEIDYLVDGISTEQVSDAQVGAFAMAILCKGMSAENGVMLTKAMRDSGDVLSWKVDGPLADKHSTGGVGDGVSLLLAPILAACGVYVPMISGRGLGHTGGTLDKLESIQGFSTRISYENMQKQLRSIGCVMAGQSSNLVPADGRLYAIRDVTATVPSIDLITASILSKKLAAGLDFLVLDVKFGLGAFMKTPENAKALAKRLVEVATALGCPTRALLTDMNTPLATSAGNAVEVLEIIEILEGQQTGGKLLNLTRSLCADILVSTRTCPNQNAALLKIDDAFADGVVAQKFEQMCVAQGGATSLREIKASLPIAPIVEDLRLSKETKFFGFDAYKIGMAVVTLGGGRQKHSDQIDHSVGVSAIASQGNSGDIIARIHARNKEDCERAKQQIADAILDAPIESKLIWEKIT